MGVELLERPKLDKGDTGDADRHAHYVKKPAGWAGSIEGYLAQAYVEGLEVEALCGYRWIPSRDPQRFPVCPKCEVIRASYGN